MNKINKYQKINKMELRFDAKNHIIEGINHIERNKGKMFKMIVTPNIDKDINDDDDYNFLSFDFFSKGNDNEHNVIGFTLSESDSRLLCQTLKNFIEYFDNN